MTSCSRAATAPVIDVDAESIVVEGRGTRDEYPLTKFMRSNQGTLIHQKPVVKLGDRVHKGDVLADGSSTDGGELALGANLLVAFMPFEGYNFEDAIVSQRAARQGRRAQLDPHPRVRDRRPLDQARRRGDHARHPEPLGGVPANLDERGVVRIGAEVGSGDLLVGKVTPKGETELTAEEKLIRAIFKEKAREVRDTSLKVPHGEGGKVIGVKTFSRDARRRPAAGRQRARPRLRREEAQDRGGRQARRPSRQQGRDLEDRPRGGHAVPRGRPRRRRRAQPARRAEPDEHRPDPRDASRVGGRARRVRGRRRPSTRGHRSTRPTPRAVATPVFDGATEADVDEALVRWAERATTRPCT